MALFEFLKQQTGFTTIELNRIIYYAPVMYKTFKIPKKNGGERIISQPTAELKFIQRCLTAGYLNKLPVHEAAFAYRKYKNVADNARIHFGPDPIVKMDFKEFFPNITSMAWIKFLEDNPIFENANEVNASCNLLFTRPKFGRILRLSIGAPSSPSLSNAIMYSFDKIVSDLCKQERIKYTRYADDLTFSSLRTGYLNSVPKIVKFAVANVQAPNLIINNEKTSKITRRHSRRVTGLVLANDGGVSIGREKKKLTRAMLHNWLAGKLVSTDIDKLQGYVAYIKSVDQAYYGKLIERYPVEISRLMKRKIARKNRWAKNDLSDFV